MLYCADLHFHPSPEELQTPKRCTSGKQTGLPLAPFLVKLRLPEISFGYGNGIHVSPLESYACQKFFSVNVNTW